MKVINIITLIVALPILYIVYSPVFVGDIIDEILD